MIRIYFMNSIEMLQFYFFELFSLSSIYIANVGFYFRKMSHFKWLSLKSDPLAYISTCRARRFGV